MMSSHLVPESKAASFARSPQLSFVFSAAAVLISLGILTVTFVGLSRYGSEAALAKAVRLSEAGSDTSEVVDELDRAVRFNRFNDTAYRDLALSLIMRVNEELADLSDISAVSAEKRQYVQALSAAAIDAARRATDLSPRHVLNWLARGSVYRSLVPLIGDAGTFALEAYGQAIALEPVNPANHTELGKTYLVVAESVRELTGSADAVTAAQAKDELQANLAAAEAAFNKAVELKSDYAPAHYQLAVTYERQGRLNDAIGKMESVRKYNPLDVGVAFQLGMLYLRRGGEGDLARAQAEFERAIELAPAYANARWFLASIYESQGNVEAAIEQVAKVLEYDPGNEIVKARLARLKAGQISPTAPSTIEP
jgi:tetratricopeptide (TPR) repeat protein